MEKKSSWRAVEYFRCPWTDRLVNSRETLGCVLYNWTNASPVELDQFWRLQTRTFQLGQTIQVFMRFLHNFVNVVVPLEVTRQGEA